VDNADRLSSLKPILIFIKFLHSPIGVISKPSTPLIFNSSKFFNLGRTLMHFTSSSFPYSLPTCNVNFFIFSHSLKKLISVNLPPGSNSNSVKDTRFLKNQYPLFHLHMS
jgi:hypothetical protein